MAVFPGNIGRATVKVEILPQSPFSGVPKQEFGYFFTQDNLNTMFNAPNSSVPVQEVVALPNPVNGFRLPEDLNNYDNFIADVTRTLLEDATATTTNGVVSVDSAAQSSAALAIARRPPESGQKEFFTWQTCKNIYGFWASSSIPSTGDQPTKFSDMLAASNGSPKWTYLLKGKPDASGDGKASELLTPFMTQTVKNPKQPVHWGAITQQPLALNQPFEILYYHDGQNHAPAQEAPSGTDKFNLKADPIGIDLTRRAYLAIQFGDGPQRFMLLFAQGFRPLFLGLSAKPPTPPNFVGPPAPNSGGLNATILDVFDGISSDALFNPNNKYFQVKVEPAKTGFIVSITSELSQTPWIIQGPTADPYLLRVGQITLYSGNVTAGFAFRPVQYFPSGSFTTPENIVTRLAGDTRDVTVTTAVKGVADIQQNLSKDADGNPLVYAVDAEIVDGNSVHSVIEDLSEDPSAFTGNNVSRTITTKLIDTNDPSNNPNAQPPAESTSPPAGGAISKKTYQIQINLEASDVQQPNGFLVKKGRSPYIWQIRAELDKIDPIDVNAGGGIDVSCDVMACDFNFNSTSLNELNHSGTIKLLNRPKTTNGPGIDYYSYIDRAVYWRVQAWWEDGVGHDPGGDDRRIFEGVSVSVTIDRRIENEIATFKVEDYMSVLEGGKFILSPYYDGMKAKAAVKDICRLAGVPDSRILADDAAIPSPVPDDPKEFGLPFSNPFQEPQFRFKDGSSYKSALTKIASLDGKTIYFDAKGNFHYDTIAGGSTGPANAVPKEAFFSSPVDAPDGKHCVWNERSYTRNINDTYNVIQVSTVDRDTGAAIHIADANDSALHDPGATGYLGYRKQLLIREPALGGIDAAFRYFMTYRDIVYKPPFSARIQLYGFSGLKPLDVISIDGDPMRILSISNHIDKKENMYWTQIEGEWFFPTEKGQSNILDSQS